MARGWRRGRSHRHGRPLVLGRRLRALRAGLAPPAPAGRVTPFADIAVSQRGTWVILCPKTPKASAHLAGLAADLEGPVLGLPIRADGRQEYVCTRAAGEVLGGLRAAGFTSDGIY